MHRTAICLTVLALIGTTFSKSVRTDEEIEDTSERLRASLLDCSRKSMLVVQKLTQPAIVANISIHVSRNRYPTTLADLSLVHESESAAKQSDKRSLLILMPVDGKKKTRAVEEEQDIIRKNQKMKRCKTPLLRERGPSPVHTEPTNPNILGSSTNYYGDEKATGYHANRSPRLRLLLKNPDTAAKRDPASQGKGDAADRGDNAGVMKAIREKLQSRDYVGAARGNFLPKTNIIDDDKYICYCREKKDPTFGEGTSTKTSRNFPKQEWLTRKTKPERNDKVLLSESKLRQRPSYANQHQPLLGTLFPDDHRYLQLPNHMNPVLQHKGNEKVPYVPYFYHLDPELMLPEVVHRTNPWKMHVPFNSVGNTVSHSVGKAVDNLVGKLVGNRVENPVGNSAHNAAGNLIGNLVGKPIGNAIGNTVGPDSLLGQPMNQGVGLKNNQIRQQGCSNVGKKPAQQFQKVIPPTFTPSTTDALEDNDPSMKTAERTEESRVNSNIPDHNLQSAYSKFSEYTTLTSVDNKDHSESSGLNDDIEKGMEEKNEASEATLQAANPVTENDMLNEAKSSILSKPVHTEDHFSDKYETTGSVLVDSSEITEVTSAYFETTGYSDSSRSTDYDDFHAPSNGPDPADHDANVQSVLNPTAQSLTEPDEVMTGYQPSSKEGYEHQASSNEDSELQPLPAVAAGCANEANRHQNEEDIMVEKSSPFDKGQSTTNESGYTAQLVPNNADYGEAKSFGNAVTPLVSEDLSPGEIVLSTEADGTDRQSGEESSAKEQSVELSEMEDNGSPLRSDYGEEYLESPLQENVQNQQEEEHVDEEVEGDPIGGSSMDETVGSNPDDATGEYTVNMDNGNRVATIGYENDNNAEPMVKSNMGGVGANSTQVLPFCDNKVLQKAIKAVINNFATDSMAEDTNTENVNAETVGSPGDDLLQEVLKIPNLKHIVSLPAIEHTILDKVKSLLTRVTGVPRTHLNTDWATNIIRDNLRNTMAAAPASELPPMTVAEHQFRNGKWVTNLVTLAPTSAEEPSSDLERLEATVRSLLRDPAVGLQAAKQPTVQNMIVQSVRKTFHKNATDESRPFDESVIQGALDRELSLMEMEDVEMTTIDAAESETVDISHMDVNKFLKFAKSEAGMDDKNESLTDRESSTIFEENVDKGADTSDVVNTAQSEFRPEMLKPEKVVNSYRKDVSEQSDERSRKMSNSETSESSANIKLLSPTESFSHDLLGVTRNSEYESSTEFIVRPTEQIDRVTDRVEKIATLKGEEEVRGQLESDMEVSQTSTSNVTPSNILASENKDQERSREVESGRESPEDTSPEHDFTYLGKISVKKNNYTDDVQSLQNSELYYVGDGVKLPLEIRKLDDGSYALSISRKVCEQLLNKECPCCVPVEGNVVRTVKSNTEAKSTHGTMGTIRRTKRISKRESTKSILPTEQKKRNPADSLQIFSMPVETFARRYNLSLNLKKVQAPWNFEAKRKIDDRPGGRAKSLQNKENADADHRYDLLSVHEIPEHRNSDAAMVRVQRMDDNSNEDSDAMDYKYRSRKQRQKNFNGYRYERNIEPVNERAEIVTNVLNWLREMILSTTSDRR